MVFNATQETKYNKFTCKLFIGPEYKKNEANHMDLVKMNVNNEIINKGYWTDTSPKKPFISISDPKVKII
jgi:hypothetical protein